MQSKAPRDLLFRNEHVKSLQLFELKYKVSEELYLRSLDFCFALIRYFDPTRAFEWSKMCYEAEYMNKNR